MTTIEKIYCIILVKQWGFSAPSLRGLNPQLSEFGLSTKQIHDINDFWRLVLVYKRDFLYSTNVTKIIEIKQSKLSILVISITERLR